MSLEKKGTQTPVREETSSRDTEEKNNDQQTEN